MENIIGLLLPALLTIQLVRWLLVPLRTAGKLAIHSGCGLVCLWQYPDPVYRDHTACECGYRACCRCVGAAGDRDCSTSGGYAVKWKRFHYVLW